MGSIATPDRSMPRTAIRSGNTSKDGRGRVRATPPILHYGFRPFFFLAALQAALGIPLWLLAYTGRIEISGPFAGMNWHVHEMLFGYLAATIAGFILTAIPNWTGRLPLSGIPLAILVALWLAGRLACLFLPGLWLPLAIDLAFPAVLALAVWREVLAGRNWKNAPVAVMISLFGIANAADHLANAGWLDPAFGQRLALGMAAMLIALIGGRIVPSFTRNWLVKAGRKPLPAPFGMLDKAALLATALGIIAWIAMPDAAMAGVLMLAAGILLGARLGRWRGLMTLREPIVLVLHIGYCWLALALTLLGLSILLPNTVPATAATHALTAGAIGIMTLAVMSRASLGHTGRPIVADRATVAIYSLAFAGALLRVSAPFALEMHGVLVGAGGTLWSMAFLLFAVRYAPILWGPRK